MNLITVIPLTRSKVAPTLSYFTASDVPVGAIVSVPLRSKQIHAIVASSRPAVDLKTEIKSAPFEIRKLGRVKTNAFFPASFMKSCRTLAEYYATNEGTVINALSSDTILKNAKSIVPPLPAQASFMSAPVPASEIYAVQGDGEDRMSSWRSLIRQEFARKRSIVAYAPTIEDAKHLFGALGKGIEGYIFLLHGSLAKKALVDTWTEIADTDHPVVVIATGIFPCLPRSDIHIGIIERENGRGWITQASPYIDIRHALETIFRNEHRTLYLADDVLRVETLYRLENHDISEGTPLKWRSLSSATDTLVDMRDKNRVSNDDKQEKHFRVLSPELENIIRTNHEENTHLFVLTSRRGLAPLTVCDDCETVVSCVNCSAPIVLHTSKETGRNFFMCHICGERRSTEENCKVCGGWRLTPLGIGTDRVREEIKGLDPAIDVFVVDADATASEKDIAATFQKFKAKPGSVLVGTETALLHLSEQVEHAAVSSLDSLLALPDFRIQEKIMYLLTRLRAMTIRSFLVQTRRADEPVFAYGLKGNVADFYRATLDERKNFSYPPFSVLIKITLEGKKAEIAKGMAVIRESLAPHELDIFPAFTATVRGNSIIHGLLKIEPQVWPDRELVEKLRALPPGAKVKINPESLL